MNNLYIFAPFFDKNLKNIQKMNVASFICQETYLVT